MGIQRQGGRERQRQGHARGGEGARDCNGVIIGGRRGGRNDTRLAKTDNKKEKKFTLSL